MKAYCSFKNIGLKCQGEGKDCNTYFGEVATEGFYLCEDCSEVKDPAEYSFTIEDQNKAYKVIPYFYGHFGWVCNVKGPNCIKKDWKRAPTYNNIIMHCQDEKFDACIACFREKTGLLKQEPEGHWDLDWTT